VSALARVLPGPAPRRWRVAVPGSKSLTNRALLLAALARGGSRLRGALRADDTEAMAAAVRALGAGVRDDGRGGWLVEGIGGPPAGGGRLWCGMAGTAGRFLLPAVAAGSGRWLLDAHPQLRRRPLGPLLEALRAQGATIAGESFPLEVSAAGLSGGCVDVDSSLSSQFLSGLLMAAPHARQETVLSFRALVSRPYLELTERMMAAFGVEVARGERELRVVPGRYRAADVTIEPDLSTASYFLAAAALSGTEVTLEGIDLDATAQGDARLVAHLAAMGATVTGRSPLTLAGPPRLHGVHVDMGDSSDVFMTLACVAPFADAPTTIEGIAHARVKESDRLAATAENLRRLGVSVQEGPDHVTVRPGNVRPARLATHDDHRIAMAFALVGTRVAVELEDPDVVAKTCPGFWELWRATGARVELSG